MSFEMRRVAEEEKEILRNLLEKYDYEFSQWNGRDVNALGLYGYGYLDNYWTEEDRFAYFFLSEGRLAGFAMVNRWPEIDRETDFCMAEFCVLLKYRRRGLGRQAAFALFDAHRGTWQLRRHPKNTASVAFWDSVVTEYTAGQYEADLANPDATYEDGTPGDVLYFDTARASSPQKRRSSAR